MRSLLRGHDLLELVLRLCIHLTFIYKAYCMSNEYVNYFQKCFQIDMMPKCI